MTDNEIRKTLDNIIRECIEKEIGSLQKDEVKQSYAERAFNEVIQSRNLPIQIDTDEDIVKITYSDLEREVKRAYIRKYGDKLDREIAELKRRLDV
ncbi:MAG: hypothetical protein LBI28_06125 [Treponema sp.]|jgi:hypothetical protein|nr:hypothetical protein [Treponema sp.]